MDLRPPDRRTRAFRAAIRWPAGPVVPGLPHVRAARRPYAAMRRPGRAGHVPGTAALALPT
ncbi:hypothetical protein DMH15_16790 [Streptomyces sp. WAC 06725]|nr:hypothetical protein DMH15_16790 [Streptomyces sp. WAC 06725]